MAQVLRSELAARGVDWADFGVQVGIPKTTAWRKIKGASKIVLDDLPALAAGLGWTMSELLARAEALQASGGVYVSDDDPQPLDPPRVNVAKILADSPHLEAVREEGQRLTRGARSAE